MRGCLQKIWRHWLIIAILAAAFLFRLVNILTVGDFAWDEMFSFTFARLGWGESWGLWLMETNPPLHLLLLKIWFSVFPNNELFARLPSLFFGVATVGGVYFTGRKYLNENVGLLAALALALMPYHIFLSGFGRGYTLLLFLAALSLYFFLKIFTAEKSTGKNFLALSGINLLMIFTHLTAILLILAQGLVLLKKLPVLKKWLAAHLPAIALGGAWLIPSFWSKLQNPADLGAAWFFHFTPRPWEIFTPLKLLFFGPGNNYYLAALILIFFLGLGREIIQWRKERPDPAFIALLAFFFIPLLSALALNLWNIKFFIIALPAGVLLIARLLTRRIKNLPQAAIAIVIVAAPGLIYYARLLPLSDWDALNRVVGQNIPPNRPAIFISTNFVDQLLLDRYYTGPAAARVYFPAGQTPGPIDFVAKNYLHYSRTDTEIADWLAADKIDDYAMVFLLQEDAFGADLAGYFNHRTNWRLIRELPVRLADPRRLLLYEKN